MTRQIILKELQRPTQINISDDIYWLGDSLGFTDGRDIERMASQVLRMVLEDCSVKGSTSSEQLSAGLGIAPQRVNYHLRSLMDSGFIFREKRLVYVRQGSAKMAVEEMRRDANRIFDSLSAIAEEIDRGLGLKSRRLDA